MNNGNNFILAYIPPDSSSGRIIAFTPGENIGDLTTDIYLPGNNDSILELSDRINIAGNKHGYRRVKSRKPISIDQVLSSVILAEAIKLISSDESCSDDRIIIFSQGIMGLALQLALIKKGLKHMVIAVDSETQRGRTEELNGGIILDTKDIGFIDHLKVETEEQGFSTVFIASNRPEIVKIALGCAGVFGKIYLLSPVVGSVNADLNSTINYKSLIVKGYNFTNHLCDLTEDDISMSFDKITRLPLSKEILLVNWNNWEESIPAEDGDRFIFVQNNVVS